VYKILTIEGIKIWIDQLNCLAPQQILPHLQVACELLMGSINGTVHVVSDNLQAIKIPPKKLNVEMGIMSE
jgi:hypothetical protein